MQREKSQLKKLGKYNDNVGNKVNLTILTNNSNADEYALQASQDTGSNPGDIGTGEEIIFDMEVEEQDEEYIICDNEYYKPLNEVCSKQRYRRTRSVIEYLNEAANKNKVTLNEQLGIILKQVNYREDKK